MLSELYIENVAVIEKAELYLGEGFHVFTGETGAGKSIMLDAINAILGNRTSRDIVRNHAAKAVIHAKFTELDQKTKQTISELGYEVSDELLIMREITADGKNTCKVNGRPATVAILKELGTHLVNIHGQHDNQMLLNPASHISFIDDYGNLSKDLSIYLDAYKVYREISQRFDSIKIDDADKARRIDLLSYQINEIDAARLDESEEDTLQKQRSFLRQYEKVMYSLGLAYGSLRGEDEIPGAAELTDTAANSLSEITDISDDVKDIAAKLQEISYELTDFSDTLRSIIETNEVGDMNLEDIESRLDVIYRLKKKYGETISDILLFRDECEKDLLVLEQSDEAYENLERELQLAKKVATELGENLSQKRRGTAHKFVSSVIKELRFLDMPNIQFVVDQNSTELTPNGTDSIEFLISTNPDEPPKPMAKIASGGELSRIMLAFKCVIAEKDDVGLLIFDEIDSGVSGSGAQKIGQKLKQMGEIKQVICVTHSPQIASYSHHHMLIKKDIKDGKAYTDVTMLDECDRVSEIARIISGNNITDIALKNAEEMLILAKEKS